MSAQARTVMQRAPYWAGMALACVIVFVAPLKFGLTQMEAAQALTPMPQGVWEWVLFSYPPKLLAYALGVVGVCVLAAIMLWRPAGLPRVAFVAGAGWLLFMAAIVLADRRVPAQWIDHDTRTQFLLYGVWMISAWLLIAREPGRSLAAQALVTAGCVVAIEALQQYFGGLERMREYAAREAGFETLSAYTNYLLQGSPDARTILLVKKLTSMRVNSTFVYPNALGGFLIVFLPLAVGYAQSVRQRLARLLAWLSCAGGSAALMLSRSKASIGLVALGLAALVWLAWRARSLRTRAWLGWTALIVAAALGMLAWGYGRGLSERLQATGGARLDYWRAAARMIVRKPWRGWGTGGFARGYVIYRCPGAEDTRLAHNAVLNIWTDYGMLGVAGVLVAIGAPLVVGWRRAWRVPSNDETFDWFQAGAVVAVSGCVLHCMVDFDFHIPGIMLPALWLAACAASRDKNVAGLLESGRSILNQP